MDKPTRDARLRAHRAIDRLWKRGNLTRGEVYQALAKVMRVPAERCHLSQFTKAQADKAERMAINGVLVEHASKRRIRRGRKGSIRHA